MSDHAWVQQNLDAYALGGLSAAERDLVAQHLASCPECERTLDELRQLEKQMDQLFADARPDAGLEERVIQRLRRATRTRPGIYRFVAAAAAVLVFGVLGFTLQAILDSESGKKVETRKVAHDEDRRGNGFALGVDLVGGTILQDDNDVMRFQLSDLTEKYKEAAGSSSPKAKGYTEEAFKKYKTTKDDDGRVAELKDPRAVYRAGLLGDDLQAAWSMRTYTGEKLDKAETTKDLYKSFGGDKYSEKSGQKPDGQPPSTTTSGFDAPKPGGEMKPGRPSGNSYFPFDKGDKIPGYFDKSPDPSKTPPSTSVIPATVSPVPVAPPASPIKEESPKLPEPSNKPPEKPAPPAPPQKQQPPEPEPAGRKIIKSGEMEFEVQSFDQAVETIKGVLRTKTKNTGFVASINSDKLPNGKMRGTMIVRMAPQVFEDFPNEVRDALAKLGSLKSQHIGSQDVTKAYTDVESELRAARAIEERFLNIIKSGKGEIKDLIAAERELGIWRTKIEKMEGEIRFYNNLIALSTLTIQISEKELQAATSLVMRERVQMSIEVDDVEAKQRLVMNAVREAKGRILKSEMKRADAGQVIAEIHADIPPKNVAKFRKDLLDLKLGTVTRHQAERTQQAEGGVAGVTDIKEREEDVRFEFSLYNTANIKPRETFHLRFASDKVAAGYRTLKDAIEKMGGQIRRAHLDEEDKVDVKAELDFNVPVEKKDAIEKLIAAQGEPLKRHTVHAAVNEMSTDRKVGYELKLRSIAAIPPKERFRYGLTVLDVQENQASLLKHIVDDLKGHVQRAHVDEQDRYNVRAELTFDIPKKSRAALDKLLKSSNAVLVSSDQLPPQADATEEKVGYSLVLRSVTSMQPREVLSISLAAADVVTAQAELEKKLAELRKASDLKVRVYRSQLLEHDQYNVTAVLDFDINKEDRDKVEKLFDKLGPIISRSNTQAGPKDDATDQRIGYRLAIRSVNSIGPRDIYQIRIASPNVPESFRKLVETATKVKARIIKRQLNEEDRVKVSAELDFDVNAADQATIDKLIADAGATVSRANNQAGPKEDATDLKVGYRLVLQNAAGAEPREKTALQIQVADVNQTVADFKTAVQAVKGRVIDSKFDRFENGKVEAFIVFEVPLSVEDNLVKQFRAAGYVEKHQTSPNKNVPENELSTAHIIVRLTTAGPILPSDEGLGEQMRRGLYFAFWIFSRVMILILTGIAGLVPLLLVLWIAAKMIGWMWPTRTPHAVKLTPTPTAATETPKT